MLVKCETKSSRVKGISFHPKLSWILASLHNGQIQLWDYRIGSLIDKFEDHKGPVRTVCFHSGQPLFVSGGDDSCVKVWNYRQRRCIFTLLGHLDYIRTVQFHPDYPWIVSASDDQTVRIWNWQSRNCIAVLTGHNHYVMCAQFHPKQDLVVSASLDQSVRIWNVCGLREKTVSISNDGNSNQYPHHVDMFGTSDAICKFVLEGHERGVNFACFHPTIPIVASGSDDRYIKLWRYNETNAWEMDTLKGHFNNVSCVAFHPKLELLLSNSEDRTIRVWDISQRTCVHTYRRESDRFWTLSTHVNSNLLAVGHDSGMVVFKMNCERPPSCCYQSMLFYVKANTLQLYDFNKDSSLVVTTCRKPSNAMFSGPKYLLINAQNTAEFNALLLYPEGDSLAYDLLLSTALPNKTSSNYQSSTQTHSGSGSSLAFVSRNRFAVLDGNTFLGIYNFNNELTKRIELTVSVDKIYSAGHNRLLFKQDEQVFLYDLTTRKTLASLPCHGEVRRIVWSDNFQWIAFISKHSIVLSDAKLQTSVSFHESIRVKGGAFEEHGAFIYATLNNVKYCLFNGDSGIIFSLIDPIYILRVANERMWYLDRVGTIRSRPLNCEEFLFKLALHKQKFDEVSAFIKSGRLFGNCVIGYLKKKGYPQIALCFVKDLSTRFNLALEYGDINEAFTNALEINDKMTWKRLAVEAMHRGIHHIVELAYQKMKNFDQLSFLYFITGNRVKLKKMLLISEKREDIMGRYQNALLLGDIKERVRVLAEVGQLPLAALIAKVHHFTDLYEELKDYVKDIDFDEILPKTPRLLLPPPPLFDTYSLQQWPTITPPDASTPPLEESIDGFPVETSLMAPALPEENGFVSPSEKPKYGLEVENEDILEAATAWGYLDDIVEAFPETPAVEISKKSLIEAQQVDDASIYTAQKAENKILKGQPLLADLIAAGEFEQALIYLRRRIALKNSQPLKRLFEKIYQSSWTFVPGLPFTRSFHFPMLEKGSLKDEKITPFRVFSPSTLSHALHAASRFFIAAKFEECLHAYRQALQLFPFVVATSPEENSQLMESLTYCRISTVAMQLECCRLKLEDDEIIRNLELACYFGCCPLQPAFAVLALRKAMITTYKAGNYLTAAFFAKRLTENTFLNNKQNSEEILKAKQMLVRCETTGTNAHKLNFSRVDAENLQICSSSLTPILPSEESIVCPFCKSVAHKRFLGSLCATCELSELGGEGLGIQFLPVL